MDPLGCKSYSWQLWWTSTVPVPEATSDVTRRPASECLTPRGTRGGRGVEVLGTYEASTGRVRVLGFRNLTRGRKRRALPNHKPKKQN